MATPGLVGFQAAARDGLEAGESRVLGCCCGSRKIIGNVVLRLRKRSCETRLNNAVWGGREGGKKEELQTGLGTGPTDL